MIGEYWDFLIDIFFSWFNIIIVIYRVIYKWFNFGFNVLFLFVRFGLDYDGGLVNCLNY